MSSTSRPYAITGLIIGGLISSFALGLLAFGFQLPEAIAAKASAGGGPLPSEGMVIVAQIVFYLKLAGGILSGIGLPIFITSFVFFLRRPPAAKPPPLPGARG